MILPGGVVMAPSLRPSTVFETISAARSELVFDRTLPRPPALDFRYSPPPSVFPHKLPQDFQAPVPSR